ncbi:hypothetical protein Pelo_11814 [Pelomyxa schiedti]|nr:hypothetical protein Pelo_11814 [Pelomyxa schiedti]
MRSHPGRVRTQVTSAKSSSGDTLVEPSGFMVANWSHPAMVDSDARLRTDANLQRGAVIDGYYFGSSDA